MIGDLKMQDFIKRCDWITYIMIILLTWTKNLV